MTDFSESGRAPGLALLLTLLASCTAGSSPRLTSGEAGLSMATGCAGPAESDRWASGVSGYHAARTFGQQVGEELVHPVGVAATANGRSALFDLGLPSVITFDSDLRETRRFGRSGRGPGEFDARDTSPIEHCPGIVGCRLRLGDCDGFRRTSRAVLLGWGPPTIVHPQDGQAHLTEVDPLGERNMGRGWEDPARGGLPAPVDRVLRGDGVSGRARIRSWRSTA